MAKGDKAISLKVEAENFGPIRTGQLALRPLTLFIGPNNSGKSYAAMLIHAIFESYNPTALPRGLPPYVKQSYVKQFLIDHINRRGFLKEIKQPSAVKSYLRALRDRGECEISPQLIGSMTHIFYEELYQKTLGQELVRSFAAPLHDLARIGTRAFSLSFVFNSHRATVKLVNRKLSLTEYPTCDVKVIVKTSDTTHPIEIGRKNCEFTIGIGGLLWKEQNENRFSAMLTSLLLDICASAVLEGVPACYYLPAARSGILQGHRALAASIVKKAPYVGLEKLDIPQFSGVVADFISTVIAKPDQKGPFFRLAKQFEKELIEGEILLRTVSDSVYPEIEYNFHDTLMPLHRASSTVSEAAPLFLYLKYILEPGSILIIEEPEAHLHPRNQRVLAKFLVRLVRRGVHVIITTHSEYLLQQLGTFIMLGRLSPKERVQKFKYYEDDFLNQDEAGVYLFSDDPQGGGHVVTEVEVSAEEGISEDEFLRIHEALYEERVQAQRELQFIGG